MTKEKIINVKNQTEETVEVSAEIVARNEQEHQDYLASDYPNQHEKIVERNNLKASAKAKLVAGEALTEEEADTIVL